MSEQIIGKKIIRFDEISSTNATANEMLTDKKLPEGTVISARYQNAGKGHGKNKWESKPGKNLTISIILYPLFLKAEEQFFLSMIISLGIKDLLELFTENIKIKWPNDIWVGNDKISGILIENSISGNKFDYSIAGIGININQENFSKDIVNPLSLTQITGEHHPLDKTLNLLCKQLDSRYNQLKDAGNRVSIRTEYINNLYLFMENVRFQQGERQFTAKITGIDPAGRLIIEHKSGKTEKFGFHEVSFA